MVEVYGMGKEILKGLASDTKRKPWGLYKENKEFVSISPDDVINKILILSQAKGWLAMMLAITYLSGSRVREVLKYTYQGTYAKQVTELEGEPITKKGFTPRNLMFYKDKDGEIYLVLKTRNEKQNSKKGKDKITLQDRIALLKKDNYKEIRIPCNEDFPDFKLIKMLDDFFEIYDMYIPNYKQKLNALGKDCLVNLFREELLDVDIFKDLKYHTVYRELRKYLGITHHNLREIRMKQLRRFYHFDVAELKIVGGWKSSDMPLRYAEATHESIINKFKNYQYELHRDDSLDKIQPKDI